MEWKKWVVAFSIGMIGASLTGCSVRMQDIQETAEELQGTTPAMALNQEPEEERTSEPEITLQSESETEEEDETTPSLSGEETGAQLTVQSGNFAYDQLSEENQHLYTEIYTILNNMGAEISISSLNADEIDRVFQYVMNDHPELFFVEGYSMTKYTSNDKVTGIELSGKYTKTQEERETLQEQIESYVNQCISGVPTTESEYEKVKYIYEYLVEHTEYSLTAPDNQNICSVFVYGSSVCQGYAKATQYLLNRLGIQCTLVSGVVRNGESHAWNLAQVDGVWCYIDTTWGDASFRTVGETEMTSGINYDYLCADDEIVNRTHQTKMTLTLPVCNSKEVYYYVKEGTYFTEYDEVKLAELFSRGYERGDGTLTIKCSNAEVYHQILTQFIEEGKIFQVIAGGGPMKYATVATSSTITFYL